MDNSLKALARASVVVCLASAPAVAGDYFVSASAGSDGAAGTSPSEAWRTLTHALTAVPAPVGAELHTIYLAPGVYDAANGETYPLEMRPRISVEGDGPADSVVLRGNGTGTLLGFTSLFNGLGETFDEDTRVASLTLENAGSGVGMYTDWGNIAPLLVDLRVHRTSGPGVVASGGDFGGAGHFHPRLLRLKFEGCAVGVRAIKYGEGGGSSVTLTDCVIAQGSGNGVELRNFSDEGSLALEGLRTVVHDRGEDGVQVSYTNGSVVNVTLEHCEIRDCGDDGYEVVPDTGLGYQVNTWLRHCTIARNAHVGVGINNAGSENYLHPTVLDSTILWGNTDDLRDGPVPMATVTDCCIGDGDHQGQNGNFSDDPLFVSPAYGDLRLRYGSPCIDRGAPLPTVGEPSLGGFVPPIDGDLDLAKHWDVGAREFAPLTLAGTATPGGALQLAMFGRAGGEALLFASRRPLTSSPLVQPEGEWWLGSSGFAFSRLRTDPSAPGQLMVSLPNDAALVGRSFSFQAQVRSLPGAATDLVWTHPVSVVVHAP